ncbi:ribosomal RNA-processing protein 8 [Colias croceus]|uniref:ribosomal RNA-processing protein 8 n=1 Tax=Colias crocea TaxID=72248 RepID=UPI001E27C5EE|nr:ribosomal RNA-processing protein 8 [Colias croceus]
MFKIPEWEASVPASNLDFLKEIKKNRPKPNNKNHDIIKKENSEKNINEVNKPNGIVHPKKNKKVKKPPIISNGIVKKKNLLQNKSSPMKNIPKRKNIVEKIDTEHKNLANKQSDAKSNNIIKNIETEPKKLENKRSEKCSDTKVVGKKRLHERNDKKSNICDKKPDLNESLEMDNFDTDKLDEAIINAKKQKLKKSKHEEEKAVEETFIEEKPLSKEERKKQLLRNVLQKQNLRSTVKVNGSNLRDRMLQRLKAAQFRYLNEKLYTSSGSDAKKLFEEDPNAFQTYHEGYQQQVKKWPVKPLDVILKRILKMPKSHLIVDMGCGEGILSRRVPQKVRSFDLVAFNPNVEVCDIAHTPLLTSSMNVAVYCLALMGTELTQFIVEANRVLKKGGHLLIAEVESRFDDVDKFINDVQRMGFSLKDLDKSNNVFYFMEFTKVNEPPKKNKLPFLSLKPCFYKKR